MNCGTIVAELRLFETVCRHSGGKGEIALLIKDAADAIENLDDICQHQADEIRGLKKRLPQEGGEIMYEDLVEHLRECAKHDKAENTFKSAADAIDDLLYICKHQATEIEELRKAVLRLEDESGLYDELPAVYIYPTKWIPVTERLPNCNGCYLVWRPHFFGGEIGMPSICYFDGSNTWHDSYGVDFARILHPEDVTHWMPLPEAPKDGE